MRESLCILREISRGTRDTCLRVGSRVERQTCAVPPRQAVQLLPSRRCCCGYCSPAALAAPAFAPITSSHPFPHSSLLCPSLHLLTCAAFLLRPSLPFLTSVLCVCVRLPD